MGIRFVIDSTTNLPENYRSRFSVVPLTLHFGNDEYVDGVDITEKRFYEMLIESDEIPTTSQPSPLAFQKAFGEAIDAGEDVIAITIASNLSGTYQSACIAASEFPEGRVYVVDSKSASIGAGIVAQRALEMADSGMAAAEIAKSLVEEIDKVYIIALIDTLEYLKKGGRISKAAAFAGGVLSIKPVIAVEGGEIKILGKARGSKKGNNLLVQQIAECGADFFRPVLFGYTGLNDDLLQKYIEDSSTLWEGNLERLEQCVIGSVIGAHVGPGAIGVAYFRNK